ncbi:MAG: ABC transporter permease [Fimbriimonas sp.]
MIAEAFLLLKYALPVALAGVGESVSQKSGVINIGIEGTMLLSAFVGLVVTVHSQSPWLGVLAGVGAACTLTLCLAWFILRLAADQVVVGTAANLFALGLTGTLFRAQFGQSGQLLSVPRIPALGSTGVDPVQIFLLLSVGGLTWLVSRSKWGLAVRAAGEYPDSAEASGFSVLKLRLTAMLVGGFYAGLAGTYLSLGIAGSFAEGMTAGRGFVAIAVVTFGRWRPFWILAASLLIGYAESLQFRFQSQGVGLPFQLFIAMPYLVALIVLVVVGKGTHAPGALGVPFRRR